MEQEIELLTLEEIPSCDFVRFVLNGKDLTVYFVKDNPGEAHAEEHVDPELGDEPKYEEDEEDHDDHDNLNGHLYKVIFKNISNFITRGEECDLYRHKKSIVQKDYISLDYTGINMVGPEGEFGFEFNYETYEIIDFGKIKGPDV